MQRYICKLQRRLSGLVRLKYLLYVNIHIQRCIRKLQRWLSCLVRLKYLLYVYKISRCSVIFANCSVAAVFLSCLAKILSNVYIYSIYIQRYIRKLQRRLSCLVLLKHLLYVNIYSRCSGIFANCSVAAVILPCVAKIFIKFIYI